MALKIDSAFVHATLSALDQLDRDGSSLRWSVAGDAARIIRDLIRQIEEEEAKHRAEPQQVAAPPF